VGFTIDVTTGSDLGWTHAFDAPSSVGAPFAGWDTTGCGGAGSDTSVPTSATSLFPVGSPANLWQLDAQLKTGYLALGQAVSSGQINAGTGHAQEGRTLGAYWLATAFTDDVWREIFGDSLTIANYVYRNTDARGVAWSLAEQSVVQNGWSLRSLLATILTSSFFNRVVEATPRMPTVFEPFLHPEVPTYSRDFAGDAVHRRSADLLFRMKAQALGWTTSDRRTYVSAFPSSTAPTNPAYPTREDAAAMSLYLSAQQPSQRTPTTSQIGMLDWEAQAGRCDRPASIVFDWIDGLAGVAVAPGRTIRDGVEALRYRLLGHGITHDPSPAPEAGLPDGGALSTEELALQGFLGRSLSDPFASATDANATLRAVCSVFTKSPYFLLEGAYPEPEQADLSSPPAIQVGDVHGPDVLHGTGFGLYSDTPSDACNGWDYYVRQALPAGLTNDCTHVELPFFINWQRLCPHFLCLYLDPRFYHPSPCTSCPQGSQWIATRPPVDARAEYTTPPMTPARTGMFLLWTETATVQAFSGWGQIVRLSGKVETPVTVGAQLMVGDALEVGAGAQLALMGADGSVYKSPDGGMPKADDGGTWLIRATGKSALPPPSTYTPKTLDPATALAQLDTARAAARNEEPGSVSFRHAVTAPSGDSSYLDNPVVNGNPKLVVIVSQVAATTPDNHVTGVWYDGARWAVYNEDVASMPAGAAFSVRAMPPSADAFLHVTTKTNVSAHITYIDDAPASASGPPLSAMPYAALQVTHVWNAPGLSGVYNAHPVGVWYDGTRWAIYNEDFAPMPVGTAFAVKIGGFDTVTSTAATRIGNALVIDQPTLNGAPLANLFLTHDWNPPGVPGTYTTKVASLAYDPKLDKWTIVNVDGSLVADNVSYGVHRGY
jgi:hypothetical protein